MSETILHGPEFDIVYDGYDANLRKFCFAIVSLKKYFKDKGTKPAQVDLDIQKLHREISRTAPSAKVDYLLGDKKLLVDQVSTTNLLFMDKAAIKLFTDLL